MLARLAGLDSPATLNHHPVADALHGIRRTLDVAQSRKKPLTRDRRGATIWTRCIDLN